MPITATRSPREVVVVVPVGGVEQRALEAPQAADRAAPAAGSAGRSRRRRAAPSRRRARSRRSSAARPRPTPRRSARGRSGCAGAGRGGRRGRAGSPRSPAGASTCALQPGFGAKENEYRCEGTSHWQPGYVLACQVPPTSSARSMRTKSSMPASLRRIARPSPAKPVPTIAMRTCGDSAAGAAVGGRRRRGELDDAHRTGSCSRRAHSGSSSWACAAGSAGRRAQSGRSMSQRGRLRRGLGLTRPVGQRRVALAAVGDGDAVQAPGEHRDQHQRDA